MIGNDIVDLQLAKRQSNWQRKNFLEKIFTSKEQMFILNSEIPEIEVWKLWSRKEAAYKIYNRETGVRGYFPWKLECSIPENSEEKKEKYVSIENKKYFTETFVFNDFIYSISVESVDLFDKIIDVNEEEKIIKINDLPFLENSLKPVSITHHGRFSRKISLLDF